MKKKTLSLTLFSSILLMPNTSFGADNVCGAQEGFALYECRVENICEGYKSDKPVYASEKYIKAEEATQEFQNGNNGSPAVDAAMKIYRENMGNIYKCAMIQSQKNSLEYIKGILKGESSGQLSDALEGQIEQRITRLDLSSSSVGCSLTDTTTQQNKLNILRETTQQLCIYTSYLEYVKGYYEDTGSDYSRSNPADSQINDGSYSRQVLNQLTKITPSEIANDITASQNKIAQEISHTYKVFPIAYQAYSEYENNYPIHVLLEVIEGDFLILRQLMYQNLMPIAQLGLKVINAMSF